MVSGYDRKKEIVSELVPVRDNNISLTKRANAYSVSRITININIVYHIMETRDKKDKLDIATKIRLFKKAIQEEHEGLALNSILAIREQNSDEYYYIIKKLYNYLFSTATFPGEYSYTNGK